MNKKIGKLLLLTLCMWQQPTGTLVWLIFAQENFFGWDLLQTTQIYLVSRYDTNSLRGSNPWEQIFSQLELGQLKRSKNVNLHEFKILSLTPQSPN